MPEFEEIILGNPEKGKKTAWVVGLVVFSVYFALYQGPAKGYWDTYITVPAVLMSGDKVDFRTPEGEPAFEYSLSQRLPHDLVGKGTYGIATKDQRIGAAVVSAPFYRLFGPLGFRLLFALIPCLASVAFFTMVQRLTGKRWLGFLGALLVVLNPFVLSYQRMNPNFIGLALVTVLFLLLESEPFLPLLAGVVLGVLGGVRNMVLIYVPILLVWVYVKGRQLHRGKPLAEKWSGIKAVLLFTAGALVMILPFMYWKQFAFGSPIAHPSQYPHFEGFRPTFPHSFLGLKFNFNGLLNYPFFDEWVRTPHFPFPVFLLIPLVFLSSFGLLLIGIGILGISQADRYSRRLCRVHLAWILISWAFWGFQENWEELKMSFLFMVIPSVVLFIVYGFERLTSIENLKASVLTLASIVVTMVVVLKLMFFLEFPEDERWYRRFPKAGANRPQGGRVTVEECHLGRTAADFRAAPAGGLPEDRRLDPEFFLVGESKCEKLEQKLKLTSACFLPCRYLPIELNVRDAIEKAFKEASRRSVTVEDIWSRIYAQQEGTASP